MRSCVQSADPRALAREESAAYRRVPRRPRRPRGTYAHAKHTPSTRIARPPEPRVTCHAERPRVTPEASTCHAGAVDRHPALLALSVSDNLEPTVAMLSDEVNPLPYSRTHLPTALAASYLPLRTASGGRERRGLGPQRAAGGRIAVDRDVAPAEARVPPRARRRRRRLAGATTITDTDIAPPQ